MNTRGQHKFNSRQKDGIAEFPPDWEIEKISRIAKSAFKTFTDGDWIETPFITDSGVRLLQTGNIGIGTFKEQGFRYISEESFNALRCTEVKPGDVLICRLADPVGRACLAPNLPEKMITSVDVCILKPSADWDSRFIVYFLSSKPYLDYLGSFSRGGTRDRVSRSFLGNVRIARPSLSRQIEIADFLDREVAKADTLLAKYERLIELLEEKRVALITHAISKGLDPSALMKDSGVEWIGEIPEHWRIVPLQRLIPDERPIVYGIVLPGPNVDDGIMIIKGGDVKPGRLNAETLNKTTFEIESGYVRSRLRAGDLVYAIRGGIGDVEIVPKEIEGANITQDAARISPRSDVLTKWLRYAMESRSVFSQLEQSATGATIRGINIWSLRRAKIPVPPWTEQIAIAHHLDSQIEVVEALISQAQKAISLTREHRSALITAAVTGQIDVRSYKNKRLEEVVA